MRLFPSLRSQMIVAVLCLLVFPFSFPASQVLKISSANYPPFVYAAQIPASGCGLGCEIVTMAFRAVSLDASLYTVPMTRNVWSVIEKKSTANLGVFRWYKVEGVSPQVDSVNILTMNFVLFYKKSRFPNGVYFTRFTDLRPYMISTVRGSFMTKAYQEAGLNISYSTRVEQNILKLEAGRVDLAIAVDLSGWQIISDRYPDKIDTFATVEKPIMTEPLALIFRKEDHKLKADFLRGLKMIVSSGVYESILTKYYQRAGMDTGLITEIIPLYLQTPEMKERLTEWSHSAGH